MDGPAQPVFFYDLGSPECYLVAEELLLEPLPVVPEFEPVLAAELGAAGQAQDIDRERLEERARELSVLPLRWPDPLPPDSRQAVLAATYAKRGGRVVAFSLAAFRQAFAGGQDLGREDIVLIAGAAAEMHPTALLKGIALRSVTGALEAAHARARAAGVSELPAIEVGGRIFSGLGAVAAVAEALAERRP